MSDINREMVLFPTDVQFNEKTDELMIDECYWVISIYPRNREELVGTKIYFCDKLLNKISLRSTITRFKMVRGQKAVFFNMNDGDWDFKLDLGKLVIEKRRQKRGWSYKWW